jgi:hypothetical protein
MNAIPASQHVQLPLPAGIDDNLIQLTDLGNARRFAIQHQHAVRFVGAWGRVAWDGGR